MELKEAVTNISHDLRTPLTAISGYLDLLEKEEKSENVQRYLSQIQNRTEVLKNLTEELFRCSVVRASQDLKSECMDVVRVLEESLLSFYAAMQERGIQPLIELPDEPVLRDLDAVTGGKLFDRFYTVEASRNSSGLGLSIAKNLIERMGGTISAQYQDSKLIER